MVSDVAASNPTGHGGPKFDWDSPRPSIEGPEVRRRVLEGIADEMIRISARERRQQAQRRLLPQLADLGTAAWSGALTVESLRRLADDLARQEAMGGQSLTGVSRGGWAGALVPMSTSASGWSR